MTIAVDMGRKATKTNKTNKQIALTLTSYNFMVSPIKHENPTRTRPCPFFKRASTHVFVLIPSLVYQTSIFPKLFHLQLSASYVILSIFTSSGFSPF